MNDVLVAPIIKEKICSDAIAKKKALGKRVK
jgi:murein endopeptidase